MTCGPYRPVKLITYTARIVDLNTRATVSSELSASLKIDASFLGDVSAIKGITAILKDSAGNIIKESENALILDKANDGKKDIISWDLGKDTVKLWWPVGYGSQELYTLEVLLIGEASPLFFSSFLFCENSNTTPSESVLIGSADQADWFQECATYPRSVRRTRSIWNWNFVPVRNQRR